MDAHSPAPPPAASPGARPVPPRWMERVIAGTGTLFSAIKMLLAAATLAFVTLISILAGPNGSFFDFGGDRPCTVEHFEILHDPAQPRPFSVDLRYRYEWNGHHFLGNRLRDKEQRWLDYEWLANVKHWATTQNAAVCAVQVNDPRHSKLKTSPPWHLPWFPVFGAAGVVFLSGAALGRLHYFWQVTRDRVPDTRSYLWIPLAAASAALLLCAITLYFGMVKPNGDRRQAVQYWHPVSARVVWTRPLEGKTEVFYQYAYKGVEHHSNRANHRLDYPAGWITPLVAVPGSSLTAYVNPENPREAVLATGLQSGDLVDGLVAILFGLAGIGSALWARHLRKKHRSLQFS